MMKRDNRPKGEVVDAPDVLDSPDAFAPGGDERTQAEESVEIAQDDETAAPADDQRDKYLRLAAEYDNFRRRTQRERAEAGSRAQADLAARLIDALDDLDRFAKVDSATIDAATLIEGVSMVEKKLQKALTAAGLEVVDPVDEPFDPARHEAVSTEPAESSEEDSRVARVYQRGYMFAGQLLRPARVAVRQWHG